MVATDREVSVDNRATICWRARNLGLPGQRRRVLGPRETQSRWGNGWRRGTSLVAHPEHAAGQEKPNDEVEIVMQAEADVPVAGHKLFSTGVAPLHNSAP